MPEHMQYFYMIIQNLAKVFTPLEVFHILQQHSHKLQCIMCLFYIFDQTKVVYNYEMGGK